ncbi:response regulator transcription factor [Phenylobacterium sp.]|uniref:LuxR C-terminal-related transcriptional regulator n=1 Tax=Phenylobacterium sp. TaxID=1871053 RepID=UPI0025E7BEEA|nr:response regulator transcription factor [Phenylobacterium sp.]MBX3483884.1 response regulator transcription factor [Phenylobacterium sp.]MCW5758338.1 response regulator transcription factor [Phenylobacterium sp.]
MAPDDASDTTPVRRGCLVVEDRPDTREWMEAVVADAFPDMAVVAAGTLRDARRWLEGHVEAPAFHLALALVDLGLPDGSGVDFLADLARDAPGALSVVATIYDDDTHLFDSLAAGAQGYILKQDAPDAVAACLQRIDAGEPPLSPSIARRMLEKLRPKAPSAPPDDAGLSARETEVLALIAKGLSAPEAARVIGLKPQTVAGYVKVIYQKLHITSRAEAALAAARRGLT